MKNNTEGIVTYQCIVDDMVLALTGMSSILAATEVKTLEKTIEQLTKTLPNMRYIPASTNLEMMQKTLKNMTNTLSNQTMIVKKINEKVLHEFIEEMVATTTNMIDIINIANKENLQKIIKITASTFPLMIQIFSSIDWEKFDPTDEDLQIAQNMINSQGIEEMILEGLSEEKIEDELSNPMKTVLLILILLYSTMEFIDASTMITTKTIAHNQIKSAIESVKDTAQQKKDDTSHQRIQHLNILLREKIPTEIIHLFMIVREDNLNVHEKMDMNSKKIGTLNTLDVVQVYEQEKDWAYVLCECRSRTEVLQGWVLSDYLEDIQ